MVSGTTSICADGVTGPPVRGPLRGSRWIDRVRLRSLRDDDLVSGPCAQTLERRPDGAGPRIDGDGETYPGERGDTIVERPHFGPEVRIVILPVPAEALVAKDVEHFRDLVFSDEPESGTWHLFTTSQPKGERSRILNDAARRWVR